MNWLLLLVWIVGAVLLVVGVCWWAAASAYPEDAEDAGDDWMDIADVISDDHHPDGCDCTDIGLEGVTPEDQAVFQRNWLALTDGERDELNEAFNSIVEGADR